MTPADHDAAVAAISHPPLRARRGARRGGRRRPGRQPGADWALAPCARGERLARHDPPGPRRPGDGRRDRRRRTRRRCAARLRDAPRPARRRGSPAARRGAGRLRTRPPSAPGSRPRGRRLEAAGVSRGAGLVVPARGGPRRAPAGTGSGPTTLDAVPGRASARRAASRRGRPWSSDPSLQAGDPVPRPARRRALLPHAAHRGPAATPGCTTAARSASAATSTRATATSPAGCAREWAEELVADFVPEFRLVGAAQRRHDRRSARSTSAWSTWPRRPAGPWPIRETHKLAGRLRRARRGAGRSTTASRPGAGSSSTSVAARRDRRRADTIGAPGGRSVTRSTLGRSLLAPAAPARAPRARDVGSCSARSPARAAGRHREVVVLPTTGVVDSVMAGYLADGDRDGRAATAPRPSSSS